MARTSTSSSRANGRSRPEQRVYRHCPLCGRDRIKLVNERLTVRDGTGRDVEVRVRCWTCPDCGERFLTPESRQKLDAAVNA
ncbi:MAG: YgiT-type zinc finger protein [Phycisphaerales bacterium]|nr:YgiT-type zinc finger protein [Phycisphaerales bacterium]